MTSDTQPTGGGAGVEPGFPGSLGTTAQAAERPSSMKQSWGPGLLILGAVVLIQGLQAARRACGQRGPGPPEPREGDTEAGEWPWQASVRRQGAHVCSGSLVADTWVLTAAHCFEKAAATELDSCQGSDLALLQLAHPVAHTPLCLPQPIHHFPFGGSCWATGWDQDTRDTPRILRNLRLRLISRPTCNCLYNRLHQRLLASPARPGMLCAGAQPGVQGPCQGDSGGPVLCREPDGHWVQAGIISFASRCAQEDTPVLLTDLAAHSPWLRAQAQGAVFLAQSPGTLEASDEDSCVACGSLRGDGPQVGAPSPWPWDARLKHQGKLACGGALVSEEVVLTAAHCFIGRQTPEEWSIGLGASPEERGLKQIILHGAYTHPEGGYDVAFLLLAQPVTLGPHLRPLCLHYADHQLPDGKRGWVLGLPHQGAGTSPAQTVPVTLLGPRACSQLQAAPENNGVPVRPGMVCASVAGEPPHCEVLSGAPLVHEVRGAWFLAGLHSFGDACHGPARPAVFTALPTYEDWVNSLEWQVYFAEEPEPEPEGAPGSCLANSSMCFGPPTPQPSLSGALDSRPSQASTVLLHLQLPWVGWDAGLAGTQAGSRCLCDFSRPLDLSEPQCSHLLRGQCGSYS
uniref:Granzyme M n=1 Tax=Oryctolagus cuniculus TaxID=9986 RepID=A0A5F9DGM4_RABIT